MENYSVLMTVYWKANPEHFSLAVESILNQTVKTDDFVVVCDGPLTPELDTRLEGYSAANPGVFNIVRLPENVGIGRAANEGLQHCRNDLVARMDADDISVSDRCEMQVKRFEENPNLTVLGGMIAEFDQDPEKPFSIREVPTDNEAIRAFARRRQPFNNMAVMYRRSAVLQVGGYRDFRRSEDYDLFLRLLHAGCEAANLDKILVNARVDRDAYSRRASWGTLEGCARSRWYAYKVGYSSLLDVAVCVIGEFVILASPARLQQFIYERFLRKKCS